jgi:hypothetical protein
MSNYVDVVEFLILKIVARENIMGFGGFFVLKIVVLFLMRGWGYIFTIKGWRPLFPLW